MPEEQSINGIRQGVLFALIAALTFGFTTPLIQKLAADSPPIATAALLYLGSALASLRRSAGAGILRSPHRMRLVVIALFGAVLAPTCLAWGLQHTGATAASLLLNCEAIFTVLLGSVFFHEHLGSRIGWAVGLMVLGGAALVLGGGAQTGGVGWGALAVVAATLAWSLDNVLTRPLAELDPTWVVRWKGAFGAALGFGLLLLLRQRLPAALPAIGLVACGATGYGLSLRFYLLAQRKMGSARTASIFATAPFVGALAAWLMGDRSAGGSALLAALLFALGVYLHITERHAHLHSHSALEHDHPHRHDDGHHDHVHVPSVSGEHSHPHRHEAQTHAHAHAPDVHHRHSHS